MLDPDAEIDTREKLEEAVRDLCVTHDWKTELPQCNSYDLIIAALDCQKAITERECCRENLEKKEPNVDKGRETRIDYTESLGKAQNSLSIETYLTNDELIAFVRELRGDAE